MNEDTQTEQTKSEEDLGEGRYLYCVINSDAEADFGEMGIEDSKVYTMPYKDVSVVVHNCPAKPYESKDGNKVKEWILAHQYIIDMATKNFGTVIPFSFDTIIKGDDEKVKEWLAEEYSKLKDKLERLKNKAEYTVQIFCNPDFMMQKIEEENVKIKELKKDIQTKPKGMAYMLNRMLERMIKNELEAKADRYSKGFYDQVKEHTDEIKVEKAGKIPGKWEDKKLVLSLSCLVHKDKVKELGNILGKINETEGFAVRFTGPWAPFSFV